MFILIVLSLLILADIGFFAFDYIEVSTVIMAVTVAVAYFFQPQFSEFIHSAGWHTVLLKYIPYYIGIGIVVACIKWILHSLNVVGHIKDAKKEFDSKPFKAGKSEYGPPYSDPAAQKRAAFVMFYKNKLQMTSDVRSHNKVYRADFNKPDSVVDALTPRAKDNISRITIWVMQWPIVIISTIFTDFVKNLIINVARFLDYMSSYITRKAVAFHTKDLM